MAYSRIETLPVGDGVCTINTFIEGGFLEIHVTRKFANSFAQSNICLFQHYTDTPILYRSIWGQWVKERELVGIDLNNVTDNYLCSLV